MLRGVSIERPNQVWSTDITSNRKLDGGVVKLTSNALLVHWLRLALVPIADRLFSFILFRTCDNVLGMPQLKDNQ